MTDPKQEHKPWCKINQSCAVDHHGQRCPGPYGTCTCHPQQAKDSEWEGDFEMIFMGNMKERVEMRRFIRSKLAQARREELEWFSAGCTFHDGDCPVSVGLDRCECNIKLVKDRLATLKSRDHE